MTTRLVTRCATSSIRGLALTVLVAAAWRPAAAALPDAVGTFNFETSRNVFSFPASASFACGAASITAAPLPTLTASGSDCVQPLQAILNYSFRINGPTGGLVPISVSSTSVMSVTGDAIAGWSLRVANQNISGDGCYFGNLAPCGSHSTLTALSLRANEDYGVTMMTIVSNSLGSGGASAFLDPQFSFDASFADAASYAFEFSAGIGNGVPSGVTPVPEPEVLSMMLLGLAGVGAWRRRRAGTAR